MKSFGEEKHVRKKSINCSNKEIRKLLLRVLERTLMDITQTKLALSPTMMTRERKDSYRNQAITFLRTEWCRDICEYTDIDYNSLITHAQKLIAENHRKAQEAQKP